MAVDLPMLRREPTCPAALSIAGASRGQQGVVCREMQADAEADPGLRMTPRALEVIRESDGGIYLNLKSDPSTVTGFCYGDALPMMDESGSARASYTACPIWESARDRHRARLQGLYDEPEPERVAHGVEEPADPWVAAREGLDELAPPPPGEGRRREVDVDELVREAMSR